MAITEAYSGTEAVGTTEHSLTADSSSLGAITTDGVYQLFADLANMAAGDRYQIRVYEKCRSADTQRVVFEDILDGAQSKPLYASPSLILMHGWEMSLKKLVGTDRTITWSIRQVA